MRCSALVAALVGLVIFLSSCGGGGSDGGSSARTGIRILHGSIEAPPFDLYSSVAPEVLQTARFGILTVYAPLSSSEQIVTLARTQSTSVNAFSFPVTVENRSRRTVVLYGDYGDLGLRSAIYDDDPGEIVDGEVKVRVIHTLVGAGLISAAVGDALEIGSLSFGGASEYLSVSPGMQTFQVRRGFDSRLVFSGSQTLNAGRAYTILVTGEIDYLVIAPLFDDS